MPILETLKKNLPFLFVLAGVIWLAVLYDTGSVLIVWPIVASFVSAGLLLLLPKRNITYAWVSATALLGFMLAGYQTYSAVTYLSGVFTAIASESIAAFFLFALLHAFLLYTSLVKPKPAG
jgi:hypothetical protein